MEKFRRELRGIRLAFCSSYQINDIAPLPLEKHQRTFNVLSPRTQMSLSRILRTRTRTCIVEFRSSPSHSHSIHLIDSPFFLLVWVLVRWAVAHNCSDEGCTCAWSQRAHLHFCYARIAKQAIRKAYLTGFRSCPELIFGITSWFVVRGHTAITTWVSNITTLDSGLQTSLLPSLHWSDKGAKVMVYSRMNVISWILAASIHG